MVFQRSLKGYSSGITQLDIAEIFFSVHFNQFISIYMSGKGKFAFLSKIKNIGTIKITFKHVLNCACREESMLFLRGSKSTTKQFVGHVGVQIRQKRPV